MLKEYLTNIANTIRNKLGITTTINAQDFATKIDEVYDAGKASMVDETKIIEKTVKGNTLVSINDVSEIPHDIGVKLSNINLFEFKQGNISCGEILEELENGAIVQGVKGNDDQWNSWGNGWYDSGNISTVSLKTGDVVTLSCDYTLLELAEGRTDATDSLEINKKVGMYVSNNTANSLYLYPANQPKLGQTIRCYVTGTIKEDGDYYPIFTINSNKVRIENIKIEFTDLNDIEVKRYGKNLWDNDNVYEGYINDSNGQIATQNSDALELTSDFIPCVPSIFYTMQSILTTISDSYQWVCLAFYDKDKNFINRIANNGATGDITPCSVSSSAPNNAAYVRASARTFGYDNAKLQLEIGSATKYEPYTEPQTAISTADGSVYGLTSISPITNLIANTNVDIEVNYHKSWGMDYERSSFWDDIQKYGEITNYSKYSYGYFSAHIFNFGNFYPKYDIKPVGDANRLFYAWETQAHKGNLKQRLEECGVILDTSQATNLHSAFNYNRITEIPTIDCTSLTTACSDVFANSWGGNKTIEKIITKEDITYNNWFLNATGLENIIFEGVIGNNINFGSCSKLTHTSLMSIINHLKDYSGIETTYTLTLGADNLAKLTDAEKSIATEKGWSLA